MKLGWIVPWDVKMCTCYFNQGDFLDFFKLFYFRGDWRGGGISIGKQLNFHCVSVDNVGGAFVSFDKFLVFGRKCIKQCLTPIC